MKNNILQKMVKAGCYHRVEIGMNESNFPIPEKIILGSKPKAFHFDHNISKAEVIKRMAKEGYKPGTIWDLLDQGIKAVKNRRSSRMQGQRILIALGSVAYARTRNACVPQIFDNGRAVSLGLVIPDDLSHTDLLGVRK